MMLSQFCLITLCIVIEIVLPGTGLKDFIPGFGPGKFIAKFTHFFDPNVAVGAEGW